MLSLSLFLNTEKQTHQNRSVWHWNLCMTIDFAWFWLILPGFANIISCPRSGMKGDRFACRVVFSDRIKINAKMFAVVDCELRPVMSRTTAAAQHQTRKSDVCCYAPFKRHLTVARSPSWTWIQLELLANTSREWLRSKVRSESISSFSRSSRANPELCCKRWKSFRSGDCPYDFRSGTLLISSLDSRTSACGLQLFERVLRSPQFVHRP